MRDLGAVPLAILSAIMLPVMGLNTLGWLVAAVWLAVLGRWGDLATALIIAFSGIFVLGIAMLLGLVFGGPAAYFATRGRFWGAAIFGALSLLYTHAVVAVWLVGNLFLFAGKAETLSMAIPLLLLGYAAATAPVTFLASKEQDNVWTMMTLLVGEVALAVVILVLLLLHTIWLAVALFAGIVGLGYIGQLAMMISELRSSSRASSEAIPLGEG